MRSAYRDQDARDEARAMADPDPPTHHRCPWPDYYGCPICMNLSDDPDEDADGEE